MTTKTQQEIIASIAANGDATAERVAEGFRKATPEQLRAITNASEAVHLLEEVDPGTVGEATLSVVALGDYLGAAPHAVSFAPMADEIEAAAAA